MIASAARLLTTSSELRNRILRVYGFLLVVHVFAWGLALVASLSYPILLPTALLAYTFGLRHAVDADHIAAIDNTTRKLMQEGQRPVAVGLFFSLGHSTIVVALSVVVAISAGFISDIPSVREIGGLIGTAVSAAFLLLIGTINLIVFVDIYRVFRRVAAGGAYDEQTLEEFLAERGLLARIFRPMLRMIRRSWHMYPLASCSAWASTPPARSRSSASPRHQARTTCRSPSSSSCRPYSRGGCPSSTRRMAC